MENKKYNTKDKVTDSTTEKVQKKAGRQGKKQDKDDRECGKSRGGECQRATKYDRQGRESTKERKR